MQLWVEDKGQKTNSKFVSSPSKQYLDPRRNYNPCVIRSYTLDPRIFRQVSPIYRLISPSIFLKIGFMGGEEGRGIKEMKVNSQRTIPASILSWGYIQEQFGNSLLVLNGV